MSWSEDKDDGDGRSDCIDSDEVNSVKLVGGGEVGAVVANI